MDVRSAFSKNMKKIMGATLAVCLAAGVALNVVPETKAHEVEHKVVRIGYDGSRNNMQGGEGERKSGYSYESYQKIADYTGWEYEYVYGDLNEILEKLKTGEIDVYADMRYVEERTEYLLYSDPVLEVGYTFITRYSNQLINDIADINGKKVGTITASFANMLFEQFSEANGMNCESITYGNHEELFKALEDGKVDAIFTTLDSASGAYGMSLKRVGATVAKEPSYFVVSKEREDLYQELNDALRTISRTDPDYFQSVYNRNLENTVFQDEYDLSDASMDWLMRHDTLRVGYVDLFYPYITIDEKTGEMDGVYRDVLDYICEVNNLKLETYEYATYVELQDALHNGDIDVLLPEERDSYDAEQLHITLTDSIYTEALRIVYKNLEDTEKPIIALPKNNFVVEEAILIKFPEAIIVEFDNLDQCLQQVRDQGSEIDATFLPDAYYLYDMSRDSRRYDGLQVMKYDAVSLDLCFGLDRGNAGLLNLMNRGIRTMGDSLVQSSIIVNSNYDEEVHLQTLIKNNPREFAGILVILALLISAGYAHYMRRKNRLQMEMNVARKDTMTGISNRSYGELMINKDLQEKKYNHAMLVIVDFDDFKRVNDKFGHNRGDETLMSFAHKMTERFTGENGICRVGGDEFVIFFTYEKPEEGPKIVDEIHAATNMDLKGENHFERTSASLGVVEAPKYGSTFKELYEKADRAMVVSKQNGKNLVTYFDDNMSTENRAEKILEKFDAAREQNHIQVYYQPVIRTITGNVCGMEALARWIDPEEGMIYPNEFIPVLESAHRIHQLDLYILEQICINIRAGLESQYDALPISFNLSRYDFIACDIYEEVARIVAKYNVPHEYLNIEITESLIMENPAAVQNAVGRFHEAGYQVWMDDFGSGYSSLNVLKDYQFDEIKLDMVFLRTFDERSKLMLASIIGMAKRIGIHTLAEGVETKEQYEFLRDCGCEKVQGYYLGKPLPLYECVSHCIQTGRTNESMSWREWYDTVGMEDFMTDQSLLLLDYDGEKFQIMYVNESYRSVWVKTGASTEEEIYYSLNAPGSPLSAKFSQLAEELQVGEDVTLEYEIRNTNFRVVGYCLAKNEGHTMFRVRIMIL